MKSKHCEIFLAASFSLILAAVPLTQAALEFSRGELPQALDVFFQAPTVENLRAYESALEESSRAAQAVRPLARQLHFFTLPDPGSKVLMGRDGWLFYKQRVDYLIQSSKDVPSRDQGPAAATRAIIRFRDQLASRGIQLLVVPVPCKARIYPDKLTRRADDLPLKSRTLEVIAALRAAGVETVDLFDVFQESHKVSGGEAMNSLYLARDTHWSPDGVRRAAEAIADRIVQLGWLEIGAAVVPDDDFTLGREAEIAAVRVHRIEHGGQVPCGTIVGFFLDVAQVGLPHDMRVRVIKVLLDTLPRIGCCHAHLEAAPYDRGGPLLH